MAAQSKKPKRRSNPRPRPASPSRAEVNQVLRMVLDQAAVLDRLRQEQDIQFRRTAQLQAELDTVKQLIEKTRSLS